MAMLALMVVLATFKIGIVRGDWLVLTEKEYPKLENYLMQLKATSGDNMFKTIKGISEAKYKIAGKGAHFDVKFYAFSDDDGFVDCEMKLKVGVMFRIKPVILQQHCEPLWEEA